MRAGARGARRGGVLARADDMKQHPSSTSSDQHRGGGQAVRGGHRIPVAVSRSHAMRTADRRNRDVPALAIALALAERVAVSLKEALGLSVRVHIVEAGALPRFEMKARRSWSKSEASRCDLESCRATGIRFGARGE